jgi:hypothetical protein
MTAARVMSGRRSWPFGLVGMLVTVAAFESFIECHRDRFMTAHELDWMSSGQAATRSQRVRSAGLLCFGDSMLKFGLSPRILENTLGRSAYSLALLDGKPAVSYFLLRRAIKAGAQPKALLVDFQPECIHQPWSRDHEPGAWDVKNGEPGPSAVDYLNENRHWKSILSVRECFDLSWTCRDPAFFVRTLVARLVPSVRCREQIGLSFRWALLGLPNSNAVKNARIGRNRWLNGGGLLLARQPSYDGDIAHLKVEVMFSKTWFNRPEETIYVRRFLQLANEHAIPVFWVLPPNTPRIEERRDALGLSARYERFLRRILELYPNVVVIDARRSGYQQNVFVDAVHLDRQGATVLSRNVAELVRASLASVDDHYRWVLVPAFVPETEPLALEDVEQSAARLKR